MQPDTVKLSPIADMLIDVMNAAADVLRHRFLYISSNLASRPKCEKAAKDVQDLVLANIQSDIIAAMRTMGFAPEDIGFLAEDMNHEINKTHIFVIDPIDGWLNYIAGLPAYTIGIGYFREHKLEANVIVQPESQRTYIAARGEGAYRLSPKRAPQRLQITPRRLSDSICDIPASPPETIRGLLLRGMNNMSSRVRAMRMTGSSLYSLCLITENSLQVSCRRFELCDIAPGLLIIEEAGGTVVDLDGVPVILSLQFPQRLSLAIVCHPKLVASALSTFHNYHEVRI